MRSRGPLWLLSSALVLAGCGSLSSRTPAQPEGLTCGRLILAREDGSQLTAALERAQPGDCVVAEEGVYHGSFTVPQDVSLVSEEGATVELVADPPEAYALRILGGSRSVIRRLRVVSQQGYGIVIQPGPARLVEVSVSSAGRSALLATCADGSCPAEETTLESCSLTQGAVGLWASGARVRVEGGRIAESRGLSLSTGHGVVATQGAQVTLRGVTVESNADVGVLADGADTSLVLEGTQVADNLGRGVWAQGLRGTTEAPRLVLSAGSLVTGNKLVGVGARDCQGIRLEGSEVHGTQLATVQVNLTERRTIGDGIGLFAGTGRAQLVDMKLDRNARSQLLVDDGGPEIVVSNPEVAVDGSAGQWKLVVQRTSATVQVPAAELSQPPSVLPVIADPLPIDP